MKNIADKNRINNLEIKDQCSLRFTFDKVNCTRDPSSSDILSFSQRKKNE